jgi:hypothetical protein
MGPSGKTVKESSLPSLISAFRSCNESLAVKLFDGGAEVDGSRYGKAPLAGQQDLRQIYLTGSSSVAPKLIPDT